MFAHNHLASVINIKANTSRLKDAKPPCKNILSYLPLLIYGIKTLIKGRLFAAHVEVLQQQ